MGLDITAYRKLTKVEGAKIVDYEPCDADGEPLDFWTHLYVLQPEGFEGREAPFEIGGVYAAEETHEFRAGSHGSHLSSRHDYAESAWRADSGPLWGWINFPDCEGVIGSDVAKKIYAEMQKMEITPENFESDDQYRNFMDKWGEWLIAFEMAADDGAIRFH